MLTPDQTDLCAGLALLYMGPTGPADEYIERIRLAMSDGDAEEAEHVSAILLSLLHAQGKAEPWMGERWATVWLKDG
mgnify:CR=1 FL=1